MAASQCDSSNPYLAACNGAPIYAAPGWPLLAISSELFGKPVSDSRCTAQQLLRILPHTWSTQTPINFVARNVETWTWHPEKPCIASSGIRKMDPHAQAANMAWRKGGT